MRNQMCNGNGAKTTSLEFVAARSEMEAATSRWNCDCSPPMPRREKRGSSLEGGGGKGAFEMDEGKVSGIDMVSNVPENDRNRFDHVDRG